MAKFYQQGDVLMHAMDGIPKGAVEIGPSEHKGVLAEGEVTGHFHRVAEPIQMFRAESGDIFMKAPQRIKVTHEEHHTIEVPKGVYKIDQVQEYDYFEQQARRVTD